MAHIKDVKIGSNTYLIEPTVYAATAGSASAMTAAVSNFALDTGATVTVKITTTNAANATLNVNGTGAKNIRYKNANIAANALSANRFYSFVYDGTYWQLIGELDTDTTYTNGTGISISNGVISNSGVTGVKGSAESSYRTGQVNLTAANIGAVAKSGDLMTGNLRIHLGDTDKYLMFDYDGDDTSGASWRIAALGSGSGDTNYFTIQSGTSTTTATAWNNAIRIGQNTLDAAFGGNVYPLENNKKTLGTSSNKWSNVYATTFTGNLTGNVTGDVTGKLNTTRITLPAISGSGTTGADQGASDTTTRYKPAVWTFNASITPVDGDIVTIKQPCAGHDYGTWLTLDNGTSYHPVVISTNSRITTQFTNGYAVMLAYDAAGTVSVFARGGAMSRTTITGVWRVLTTYDSNSNDTAYYHRRIYPNLKAGTGGIFPYTLIMQLPDGKWSSIVTSSISSGTSPKATGKAVNTNGFMVGRVLLMYANASYSANGDVGTYNIWSAHTGLIDARYSFNLENATDKGFVRYTPVYIVGTIDSNGLFKLDTTKWWSQTLPATDDGKVYIYIGDAYDWYRLTFTEDKPIYWYKDGKIQLYSGYASGVALSNVTGADDLKAIEALSNTTGILRKTAANTWTLDTAAYTTNTGTVTNVAASGSGGITISGSPITTSGTIAIGLNLSTAINGLGEGTSPSQLDDYLVSQFAGGGTTTTTYHRRKVKNVVNGTVVKAALGTNATHSNGFLRKDGTWQVPPYPVTSVAGKTGAVTLVKGDVGLGNVDNTADADKTVKDLTNFKTSKYTIPPAKGVRITYPSYVPVLISCQRANSGGRLLLLGGGYGAQGTVRNDFTELVSCAESSFTWSLPNSTDISCAIEIMNNQSSGNATVWVWTSNTCTFTEITALTTDAMNAKLLTTQSSLAWNKLTGKPTTISGYGITDAKIENGVITLGSNTITPITNIAGKTGSTVTADALRTALGLSNAMHFLGVTTTNVSTGTANTTATVAISGSNVTAAAGDVVLYNSQEYVWGNSKWNLLGDESSYKVKQSAVSDPTASGTSTTFISSISQNANGVISVSKANLPVASRTAAGIVSDGTQAFKGVKIFGGVYRQAYNGSNEATRYPGDTFLQNNAGTTVAEYWYDIGDATNITTGKFTFRQYSPNTTANTSTTGYREDYSLPTATKGLTENKSYSILTTKDLSFSITGNAATATKATYLAGAVEAAPALTTNPGAGLIRYSYNVNKGTTGLFNNVDNSNSILTLNRHSGDFCSQLGFSSDNNIYYRAFSGAALNNTKAWEQIAFISSTVAGAKQAKHASAAHYSTTSSTNNAGVLKVKIKKQMAWMLAFTLRVYQRYHYIDYVISGYNYGSNHWHDPEVYILSNSESTKETVTFGYDEDANSNNYCTLWASIPRNQYTGADIFNVTNGFTQITDLSDAFEIVFEAESTGVVQTTVDAYRPLLYNEKASSATTADSATTAGSATTANTAGAFTSAKSITLSGDTTGSASSTGGWTITTTTNQLTFKNGRIASADLDISTMHSKMILTLASSSMTTSKPPMGNGYIITYGWDNAFWGAQHAISHTKTPHMAIRGTNGGSSSDWGDWIYLLDANNYTDYTVKKDGTGATGSWGISITGTAGGVSWANISNKPLTLTAAATGFTISGGTTSKTLTVSDSVTLKTGAVTYLAYYSANGTISGHGAAHFSDTYSSSTTNGKNELVLGNSKSSTTDGSAYGQVALYSSGTAGTYIKSADNSTSWYTATLQAKSGTIAYTSDLVDTKNTAGSTNSTSKLFLVGPTSQAASAQTYSNQYVYTTNGALAAGSLQLNANTANIEATIGYNTTTECITFSFD